MIVAIDGTAGSGKGTLANEISKKLNFTQIDTGAMYRCVALYMINNNIKLEDIENINKALEKIQVNIDENKISLNGKDVSKEIRSEKVTDIVSEVSCIIDVRKKLVAWQREMAIGQNVVMDGRDIGTVVFPNAEIKIYLDADINARVERRYKENVEKGIFTSKEDVFENIKKRDYQDKNKPYGKLVQADDAYFIDTTNLTIDEVANIVIDRVKKWRKENEQEY